MTSSVANHAIPAEVTILAKLLARHGKLPREMAEYLLTLGFDNSDRARMHDLAVRNQADNLNALEKEELFAFSKAGTLLSILKSKARRMLRIRTTKRTEAM